MYFSLIFTTIIIIVYHINGIFGRQCISQMTVKTKLANCLVGDVSVLLYRKQQKLSDRKVWWLSAFYPNVEKTLAVFASTV